MPNYKVTKDPETHFMPIDDFFNHLRECEVLMINNDLMTKDLYEIKDRYKGETQPKVIFYNNDSMIFSIEPSDIKYVKIFSHDLRVKLKSGVEHNFKFYDQVGWKEPGITVGGLVIKEQKHGPHQYLYVKLDNGHIQIKLDDEGVVVDIMDDVDECIATTCSLYTELITEDEL
jgi:hypothetical protein